MISLTTEQRKAVALALARNVVLRAGPGSGKTEVLKNIYRDLRHEGRVVVVMSYTHASADSFNDRIGEDVATTMHAFCKARFGVDASFEETFRRTIEIVERKSSLPSESRITILVDEAQDCNEDQFRLLEALMRKGYHVVCVGDAQQSIYKFHGAAPDQFLSFDAVKEMSGFDLTENWRSTPALVAAFNVFAQHNFKRPILQVSQKSTVQGPSPRFAAFGRVEELYEEIARLHLRRPMLTALLVLDNRHLDQSHVLLFKKFVASITFSAARSDEFKRVPEDLRCDEVMQLLTIWGAKGHEFMRVIVLGAEDQGEAETEERARLLFVAMTRAIEELHVFSVPKAGATRPFSRFLEPLLPLEFRRGSESIGAGVADSGNLQVRKVSEAFGEDLLRSVFLDKDATKLFADDVLEVGHSVGAPNKRLTRFGLETAYGVIMEEMARGVLSQVPLNDEKIHALTDVQRPFVPQDHPLRPVFVRLRGILKSVRGLKPFAVKRVIQRRLNGGTDRVPFFPNARESKEVQRACEQLIDAFATLQSVRPELRERLRSSVEAFVRDQNATYEVLRFLVRDEWHIDHPNFEGALALLSSSLRSDTESKKGSASIASLGLALKRSHFDREEEDLGVLRTFTHLCPPQEWPSGLRLSLDDIAVPEVDTFSVHQQGDVLLHRGYKVVQRKKQYLNDSLGRDLKLCGEPDILGEDFVVEIKHVTEVTLAHACQALLYAVIAKVPTAILWDMRHGRHYVYTLREEDRRRLKEAVRQRYSQPASSDENKHLEVSHMSHIKKPRL